VTLNLVLLVVQRETLWLATGKQLFVFRGEKLHGRLQVETDILSLAASAPFLPRCVVARLRRGVALHWATSPVEDAETVCPELPGPLTAFTADGTLILLSGAEGRICDARPATRPQVREFTMLRGDPIAVTGAAGKDQFAVFWQGGQVQVYRVPG
jgi:hypothetical protein